MEIPAHLLKRKDELGLLGRALKTWLRNGGSGTKCHRCFSKLASSSGELSSSVEEVSKATQEIARTMTQVAEGSVRQKKTYNI